MKSNHNRLLSLLVVLSNFAAFSRTKPTEFITGSVSGVVIDNQLNQPIPYATIVIINTNGETLTGGITNDDGVFEIEKIPEDSYTLKVQFIGSSPYLIQGQFNWESNTIYAGFN